MKLSSLLASPVAELSAKQSKVDSENGYFRVPQDNGTYSKTVQQRVSSVFLTWLSGKYMPTNKPGGLIPYEDMVHPTDHSIFKPDSFVDEFMKDPKAWGQVISLLEQDHANRDKPKNDIASKPVELLMHPDSKEAVREFLPAYLKTKEGAHAFTQYHALVISRLQDIMARLQALVLGRKPNLHSSITINQARAWLDAAQKDKEFIRLVRLHRAGTPAARATLKPAELNAVMYVNPESHPDFVHPSKEGATPAAPADKPAASETKTPPKKAETKPKAEKPAKPAKATTPVDTVNAYLAAAKVLGKEAAVKDFVARTETYALNTLRRDKKTMPKPLGSTPAKLAAWLEAVVPGKDDQAAIATFARYAVLHVALGKLPDKVKAAGGSPKTWKARLTEAKKRAGVLAKAAVPNLPGVDEWEVDLAAWEAELTAAKAEAPKTTTKTPAKKPAAKATKTKATKAPAKAKAPAKKPAVAVKSTKAKAPTKTPAAKAPAKKSAAKKAAPATKKAATKGRAK